MDGVRLTVGTTSPQKREPAASAQAVCFQRMFLQLFLSPFTGLQQGAVGGGGGGCRHHVNNNPSSLFQQ